MLGVDCAAGPPSLHVQAAAFFQEPASERVYELPRQRHVRVPSFRLQPSRVLSFQARLGVSVLASILLYALPRARPNFVSIRSELVTDKAPTSSFFFAAAVSDFNFPA